MNRETVIELAREAGYIGVQFTSITTLERFAALVAAHEREQCAKVCDKQSDEDGWEGHYAHGCAVAIRSRT